MSTIDKLLCVAMLFLALLPVPYASAQPAPTERRLALVIGNGE
jgi:hypothetical protein